LHQVGAHSDPVLEPKHVLRMPYKSDPVRNLGELLAAVGAGLSGGLDRFVQHPMLVLLEVPSLPRSAVQPAGHLKNGDTVHRGIVAGKPGRQTE
jgi:hypothetical protein